MNGIRYQIENAAGDAVLHYYSLRDVDRPWRTPNLTEAFTEAAKQVARKGAGTGTVYIKSVALDERGGWRRLDLAAIAVTTGPDGLPALARAA